MLVDGRIPKALHLACNTGVQHNHNNKVQSHVQDPDRRRPPVVSRGHPQCHQRRLSRQRGDGNRRPRQRPGDHRRSR
ncbi:protein of unknown function [Pseudomonas sp. JV241A]|nr:protein of unknown function [Pseudomonas sp. JV241A]